MSGHSTIERFWYSNNPLRWLLWPLSLLIQLIALFKRFCYQNNIFKVTKNAVPVIVVGNITVGGTGKTPFISSLVKHLQSKKMSVGIVSRGYLSQLIEQPHIITGSDNVKDVGDEAFMLFNNLKIPMAIGSNRAAAVSLLAQKFKLDVIISDDGLQHYSMQRAFEILMVDSTRMFGNKLMLPFGPLREPISRINSVDYIVQNGSHPNNINIHNVPNSIMDIKVSGLVNLNKQKKLSLTELNQYSICAVVGIGNPQRFFNSLSDFSNDFTTKIFADHHDFTAKDFEDINDQIIIMTEKDAVKCQSFAKYNWYYLKVDANLKENDFDNLYELIDNKILTKLKNK